MADKRHIFRDVSVINRFNAGNDRRLLQRTLSICLKKERTRLRRFTLRSTPLQTLCGSGRFQLELQNRFDSLKTTSNVGEMTDNMVTTVCTLSKSNSIKQSNLSPETLDVIRRRREMPSAQATSPE
ncbi:unnamed protein product [Euphydryas editha]|uniref:Uncharacterized protein n=1 Tax=Euphydryas editha TaxID=104508 RepID=A0AAU9TVD1_EUPED|nr:unnamed protein product [Euphydryas editha]